MKYFLSLFFVVTALAATGCADKYALENRGPDEFVVLKHPPLSLPPDFTLRAPDKKKQASVSKTAQEDAKTALLGSSTVETSPEMPSETPSLEPPSAPLSEAENTLLDQIGKIDQDIRRQLDQDQTASQPATQPRDKE